jgi:cytoskeletal protein RodZ
MLREARIRRGLTIRDVSDVTKIRTKYLEALEQDDYEVIPGSTFVKAYMRSYASFLRLDADALVDEYRYGREPRSEELGPYNNTGEQSRSPSVTARKKRKGRRDRRGYALIGVLAVVVVVLLAWFGTGRGQPAARLGPESVGSTVSSTATSETGSTDLSGVTTTVSGGTGESTTSTSGVVASGGNVTLALTVAEGSCFLVVREDNEQGAELYAGTLSAGEEKIFDGSKRYWLHIGAPEVLVLSVNGVERAVDGPAGYYVVTETQITSAE